MEKFSDIVNVAAGERTVGSTPILKNAMLNTGALADNAFNAPICRYPWGAIRCAQMIVGSRAISESLWMDEHIQGNM
jgi:hypothetical protein